MTRSQQPPSRARGGRRQALVAAGAIGAFALAVLLIGHLHDVPGTGPQARAVTSGATREGRDGAASHAPTPRPSARARDARLPGREVPAAAPRPVDGLGLSAAGLDTTPADPPAAAVRLAGRVVRRADGSPVPHVIVEALGPPGTGDPKTGALSCTRTQFDGSFVFLGSAAPPETLRLTFPPAEVPVQLVDVLPSQAGRTDLLVTLDTGWSLSAHAVDAAGRPIPHPRLARVRAPEPAGQRGGRSDAARIDAGWAFGGEEGCALLRDLPRAVPGVAVRLAAGGHQERVLSVRPPPGGVWERTLDVRLEPGAEVRGTVRVVSPAGRLHGRDATIELVTHDDATDVPFAPRD